MPGVFHIVVIAIMPNPLNNICQSTPEFQEFLFLPLIKTDILIDKNKVHGL